MQGNKARSGAPSQPWRREVNNLLRPQSPLRDIDLTQRPGRTVSIGGKLYRTVDNGHAEVLVEVPFISPTEQAMRERGVRQAVTMAGSSAAAAAFDAATLLGASPEQRDVAMNIGAAVGSVFSAASPLGATRARPAPVDRNPFKEASVTRAAVRERPMSASGLAQGGQVTATREVLGTGQRVNQRYDPPGWRGDGDRYEEDRRSFDRALPRWIEQEHQYRHFDAVGKQTRDERLRARGG